MSEVDFVSLMQKGTRGQVPLENGQNESISQKTKVQVASELYAAVKRVLKR